MSKSPKILSKARAVIIGGGVSGCSVAYHLAKMGWTDIVLLERKQLPERSRLAVAKFSEVSSKTVPGFGVSSPGWNQKYSAAMMSRMGSADFIGRIELSCGGVGCRAVPDAGADAICYSCGYFFLINGGDEEVPFPPVTDESALHQGCRTGSLAQHCEVTEFHSSAGRAGVGVESTVDGGGQAAAA